MFTDRGRWVLAFDGSCGSCSGIADAVSAAAGTQLDVLPLQSAAVTEWRQLALGDDAAWKPVLLRVSDEGTVQAWTGLRLGGRLIGRLGVGGSLRVVRTIGRLRAMNTRGEVRRPGDTAPLKRLSRKRLVRDVGLGAVTVIQIAVTGTAPAAADTVGGWERAVEGSLPTTLPELAALPVAHRRVAYRSMTPYQQSAAWTAHLNSFSDAEAGADDEQRAALADARAFAQDPTHFSAPDTELIESVGAALVAAYGRVQATTMIAVLGPPDDVAPGELAPAVTCGCSTSSDYCTQGRICRRNAQNCTKTTGCGTFYSYQCDGLCG